VCLIAGVVMLLLCTGGLLAQASSDNYVLSSSSLGSGGGPSASDAFSVTGSVSTVGAAVSSNGDRALYSGILVLNYGVGGTFLAYHNGHHMDTVEVSDRTLKVAYGGGEGPVMGTIYSRLGGQRTFTATELSPFEGDTLMIEIPAERLNARGLEFYFVLERGRFSIKLGDDQNPYIYVTHVTNETGQRPAATPDARYRMVGVPLSVEGSNSVTAVFADDLGAPDPTKWRLGSYVNPGDSITEFPDAAPVTPSRAYWLITNNRQRYGADGFTVRPDREYEGTGYYTVPLRRGWNQVANPFPFDLDWRQALLEKDGVISGRDSTLIDDNAYWYSGSGYFLINTLLAWEGFFVFARKSGVHLLLPYRESSMGSSKRVSEPLASSMPKADWLIEFKLEADGLVDEGNFAGVWQSADEGADDYDSPDPPSAPGGPNLGFQLPDNDPYLRRCDIRAPFDDGTTWDIRMAYARGRTLTVTGVEDLPENFQAVLILDVGQASTLSEGVVIEIPPDVRSARLVVGDQNFTAEEVASVLPQDYELMQNFPNPFNPYTNIRFGLPYATNVLLEVYNLLGQRVTTLVNGPMDAGTHTVVWNGIDADGRQVATGVYFYRLTTPDYTDVKKMLLLK
jgi:hypothetical protein